MLGFIFGTLCLFALVKVLFGGHRHWGGRHRHHRRRRTREGLTRAAGEVLKRRLDIDDDQEGIVDHALMDLRDTVRELRATLGESRVDLAAAFAGETVDDGAIGVIFAQQDEELSRARRQAVSALKQIHAVLDEDQRAEAVRLVEEGPGARLGRGWGVS